jgi:hypothetical protein
LTLSIEASSLTAEQRLALQTIYDHFHAHASWRAGQIAKAIHVLQTREIAG